MDVYNITQTGRVLSSSAIKINKYDNKTIKLNFVFDGTISGRLYYLAMLNPVTKLYEYHPLTNGTVLLGNSISRYPGRWSCILMATEDYALDATDDIDESRLTWVSNVFNKIVVIDNFLDDDAYIGSLSYPAIDEALNTFTRNMTTIQEYVTTSGEDVTACENVLTQCQNVLAQCQLLYAQIQAIYERMSG